MHARWKSLPCNPLYAVSDKGSVRSKKTRRVVKAFPNHGGYMRVQLCDNGKRKNYRVPRLVLLAFVGPPPADAPEACHEDGNRRNNALKNLYWGTKEQNTADRAKHLLARHNPAPENIHRIFVKPKKNSAGKYVLYETIVLKEFFHTCHMTSRKTVRRVWGPYKQKNGRGKLFNSYSDALQGICDWENSTGEFVTRRMHPKRKPK